MICVLMILGRQPCQGLMELSNKLKVFGKKEVNSSSRIIMIIVFLTQFVVKYINYFAALIRKAINVMFIIQCIIERQNPGQTINYFHSSEKGRYCEC